MKSRIDDRPAGTTRGRTCEGHIKNRSLASQLVNVGGVDCMFAIAAQILAEVIGDQEQDIIIFYHISQARFRRKFKRKYSLKIIRDGRSCPLLNDSPRLSLGFSATFIAEQALLLLQEDVYNAWRSKKVLNLVSFDVKGAYNGVCVIDAIIANKRELDIELFGLKGYFLAENGYYIWGEVLK